MSSLYTYIYSNIPYRRKLLLSYKLISLSPPPLFHLQFLSITPILYPFYSIQTDIKISLKKKKKKHPTGSSIAQVTLRVEKRIFPRVVSVVRLRAHDSFPFPSRFRGALPRLVLHFSRGIHFCPSASTLSTSLRLYSASPETQLASLRKRF